MDGRSNRTPRIAYGLFAGALCLAAIIAIVLLVLDESGDFAEDLGITAGALLVHGLAVAAGIALLQVAPFRWLALISIAVGTVGFALTASLGWSSGADDDPATGLLKAAGCGLVWSLALAQTAILLARRNPDDRGPIDVSIGIAVFGACSLAALLTVAILDEITDDTFFRWVTVAAVLWLLGATLVPTMRKLGQAPR